GSIGLGFAIPIDQARTIAQALIRTGRYQHADLGVNVASVTNGASDGARVQNVQQGGAAAEAGIMEDDVITKVGNRAVGSADELIVAVREHKIGEEVSISLVRDRRPLVVNVRLRSD
ncbi:MAG TPA: PDZ domain-containing protein, partial [Pseudonocardiaceae bacterium]